MCVQSKKLFNVCAVWCGMVRCVAYGDASIAIHAHTFIGNKMKWNEMKCVNSNCGVLNKKKFSMYLFWLLLLLTYWRWKYLKAKCRTHTQFTLCCITSFRWLWANVYDTAICLRLWFNCQQHKYYLLIWSINIEEPPTHKHTHIAIALFELTLKSSSYLWSCSRFRLPLSIDLHQVGMDYPIRTPCCNKRSKTDFFSSLENDAVQIAFIWISED